MELLMHVCTIAADVERDFLIFFLYANLVCSGRVFTRLAESRNAMNNVLFLADY